MNGAWSLRAAELRRALLESVHTIRERFQGGLQGRDGLLLGGHLLLQGHEQRQIAERQWCLLINVWW